MKTIAVCFTGFAVSVAIHALALGAIFAPPAPSAPASAAAAAAALALSGPAVVPVQVLKPLSNPPMWRADKLGIDNVLPPAEFDRPFAGKLNVVIARDVDQILAVCPVAGNALACMTVRGPDSCTVFRMPDDFIEATGEPVEVVMRHEIGHCNGWSGKHENARTWFKEVATTAKAT